MITIAMIEEWILDRQAKDMPIATIRKVLVSMGQIFKYAARHRYIAYNPFLDAEKPKGKAKGKSIRVLVPDEINSLIDKIDDQKKWKLACQPNKLNLVFPNEAGGPLNHNNVVSRYFNPALKAAKIDRIRFHDLRHTYASLLIEQGENIKYIQTQLGHSSPTVTLNVYAHLMNDVNQEAACRLENSVFNSTGHKTVTVR